MSKSDKKRANSAYVYRMMDGTHEWDYGNGLIVRCNPEKGSAAARHFLLNYGIKQWIQDGGAVSAGENGKVDVLAKYEGMRDRAELIESGVNELIRRAAGGGVDAGLTIRAMMRALGKDLDTVEALLAVTCTKRGVDRTAALKLWADAKQVAQAILDIKRERAAGGADADDLLAEMEAVELDDDESDDSDDDSGEGEDEEALM